MVKGAWLVVEGMTNDYSGMSSVWKTRGIK